MMILLNILMPNMRITLLSGDIGVLNVGLLDSAVPSLC